MSDLKISLSESVNPRYIYISPENVVHVMIPIISADQVGIGLDNTCQSVVALKDFFGLSHNSVQLRNSCLNQLQAYKAQLQNDINTLVEYGQSTDSIRSRLSQVDLYINVLRDVSNRHSNLLDGLNNPYPQYPRAFQNLITQSNSNLYAMRLKPRNEDGALRTQNPLFHARRSDQAPTVLYSSLISQFRRISDFSKVPSTKDGFINLVKQKIYDKSKTRYPTTIGILKQHLSASFEECIQDAAVRASFCNDVHLFSTLEDLLGYSDKDKITSDKDLVDVLDGLINSFGRYELPETSAFSTIRSESSAEQKAEKLSILTQFFLAEINIYAQSKGLLSEKFNFAQPLDSNPNLADQFAQSVKATVENGCEIEKAIFEFINLFRSQFKLTRELNIQEQAQIKAKVNSHYRSVKDSQHMDEFMVLDTEKQTGVPFYYHQGSICCDFTKWYEQTRLSATNSDNFNKAIRESSSMPAVLRPRDSGSIGSFTLDQNQLQRLIQQSIYENNYDKASKLLLNVGNEYVFQKLGSNFFKQYSSNPLARTLFNRLRASITDPQISASFNEIVIQHKQQLLLTPDMARSLYVAVQDRQELPIDRVLKYGSADEIRMILNDLATLGRNNNPESNGYQNIKDFDVSTGSNGNLLIDAPEQTIRKLQEIIACYKRSAHLAMIMSSSIYKQVLTNYGPESQEYKNMQALNNNLPGDQTPHKLLKALELLGINIPKKDIRYNNTKNGFEYKTPRNANDGHPKKGGSGFIIDNIDSGQWRLIEEITEMHANKFAISVGIEQTLYNQINQLQANDVLDHYSSRRDKLEAALILLGIQFRRLEFDANNNQFILYANQAEQAKIKKIKDIFAGQDAFGIPFNNEDRQFTRNYAPQLIVPNSGQRLHELVEGIKSGQILPSTSTSIMRNSTAIPEVNFGQSILQLTPDMARSIYVAVQDRKQLPVDRVLKYLTPEHMNQLLQELTTLARQGNTYSNDFAPLGNCNVAAGPNNSLVIRGSEDAIRRLTQLVQHYRGSIHLAMVMSSGLYKEVEARYGSESKEYKQMMSLSNNPINEPNPTPYKLLEALKLLGITVPPKGIGGAKAVRFNNTLNALEYMNVTNQRDGREKKGGSGFIIDGLIPADLQKIEEITERQAYATVVDIFHEIAFSDAIESFNNPAVNELLKACGDDRRLRVETALILLGINVNQVIFNEQTQRFNIQAAPKEQSKIKCVVKSYFDPMIKQIERYRMMQGLPLEDQKLSPSILIFNQEDEQNSRGYRTQLIQGYNLAESVQQKRVERQNASVLPLVLPYRHSVHRDESGRENQNTMPPTRPEEQVTASSSTTTERLAINNLSEHEIDMIAGGVHAIELRERQLVLAEQERQRARAEQERQRVLAEQERQRARAEQERQRALAEQERQRVLAEQERQRVFAERERQSGFFGNGREEAQRRRREEQEYRESQSSYGGGN